MRNLKKVLSLVLCLAVMLSVMVVGAGAAFSDQDKIENTEAVDACSALNIINGYEDGAFHPERNIKRAEVTKMICVALNAGEEPNTSTNAVPTFDDVRGTTYAWAEGYIESCVAQGIVDGVGGKRFSPAGNVTGAQLAKMLLVSLGYNATTEKFTGAAWETYVNVRASQKHLYDGLDKMDTSAPVTRDQAAQMIWNALQAYVVEYKDGVVQDKVVGETKDKITLLYDKYEAVVETGSITEAPSSNVNPKGIKFQPYGNGRNEINFRNATQDVSDLLGYEVKVVFKATKVDKKDAIYGIYKTENNKDYTATWKDIEKDGTNKVKFGGKSYKLESQIDVYADGADKATWSYDNFNKAKLADQVTFIDSDGNGKIDAAQVKTQDVTKVTYVGSDNIDTKALLADGRPAANKYTPFASYETNPKLADVNTYKGIAKDDYVKVSYDYYNDKVTYEKIDAVEAKIEATRTTGAGTKEIRIDGTWYEPAAGYDMPSVVSGDAIKYIAIGTLLYNVEKVDGIWGSKSLAVVYDVAKYGVGSKANELEVSFITRDGVKKTALLDKYNNVEVTFDDKNNSTDADDEWNVGGGKTFAAVKSALQGNLMTYRESGNEVSLMPVSATQAAGYDDIYSDVTTYVKADGKLTSTSKGNVSIADTAVAFVWDASGDADVLTGKAAKSAFKNASGTLAPSSVAAGGEENGVNYIQAFALKVDDVDGVNVVGSNYAYVISASETVNKDDYREFLLWTAKGELTAYEKTSDFYEFEGGEIISYDVISTADNRTVIDNVEIEAGKLGRVTSDGLYGTNKNKVAIGGADFELDADCEIVNVNTDKKEGIEGDAAAAVRMGKEGLYNIFYLTNGEGDIVFILVDSKNDAVAIADESVAALPANPSASAVNSALASTDKVTVPNTIADASGIVVPEGKTLVVDEITTVGTLKGTGSVVVNTSITDANYASLAAPVAGVAGQTVDLPAGLKLSGTGDVDKFWDGKSLNDLAAQTGSTSVTFKHIQLSAADAPKNATIKGERFFGGQWQDMDGVLGNGSYTVSDTNGFELLSLLGDKITQVRLTVTPSGGSAAKVFTFNNK